jgi:hypothetical protein
MELAGCLSYVWNSDKLESELFCNERFCQGQEKMWKQLLAETFNFNLLRLLYIYTKA